MIEAKIALIADVHGNLPALKRVLSRIDDLGCDFIYHLGDAIDIGPYPSECLDMLFNRKDVVMLMGNHERYAAYGPPDPRPSYITDAVAEHIVWTQSQLGQDMIRKIRTFPYQIIVEYAGNRMALLHCPLSADDFTIVNPDDPESLDRDFAGIPAETVCIGHIHMPFEHRGVRLIHDPGSAGTCTDAVTRFSMVSLSGGKFVFERFIAEYDRQPVLDALLQRHVPDGENVAKIFFGANLSV